MSKYKKSEIPTLIKLIGKQAKASSIKLASTPTEEKNRVLELAATYIDENKKYIFAENAKDMNSAKKRGLSRAMLDRLYLDESRIIDMSNTLINIVELTDPVGTIIEKWNRPNGLSIQCVRAPIGVISVIFESRPNVTVDAAALGLKAGNATILRCGSESYHSCNAIMKSFNSALKNVCLPEHSVQLVPTQDRLAIDEILGLDCYIDLVIPRGGKSLIKKISSNCKIPLLKHLEGLCHTYIHESADREIARSVTFNAKMRRPGICGATETLLVDKSIAKAVLPSIFDDLIEAGCEVRGDIMTSKLDSRIKLATNSDWNTEYLDNIISVRQVDGIEQALLHIQKHGSQHTDSIIASNKTAAETFLKRVDSAIVMVNTSTQFADGGEFGMGAEMGIGTGKLHARGPVGLQQLTSMKYLVRGTGQVRP